MAQLAQDAAESLDGRIEDEELDGMEEAVEVREVLRAPTGLQHRDKRGDRCVPDSAQRLMREASADRRSPHFGQAHTL